MDTIHSGAFTFTFCSAENVYQEVSTTLNFTLTSNSQSLSHFLPLTHRWHRWDNSHWPFLHDSITGFTVTKMSAVKALLEMKLWPGATAKTHTKNASICLVYFGALGDYVRPVWGGWIVSWTFSAHVFEEKGWNKWPRLSLNRRITFVSS